MPTLPLPSPVHTVPQESLLWPGDPNQYECLARTLENGKSASICLGWWATLPQQA